MFAFARADERPPTAAASCGVGPLDSSLHLRDALDLVSNGRRACSRNSVATPAAGVTIDEADFPRFRELSPAVADELLAEDDLTRTLHTDGTLESGYFSLETARLLKNEIWGQGFPAPLFEGRFYRRAAARAREKHLKLHLKAGGLRFEAIQFNFAETPGTSAGGVSVERE